MKNLFAIIEPWDLDIAYDKSHANEGDIWERRRYLKPNNIGRDTVCYWHLQVPKILFLSFYVQVKYTYRWKLVDIEIHVYHQSNDSLSCVISVGDGFHLSCICWKYAEFRNIPCRKTISFNADFITQYLFIITIDFLLNVWNTCLLKVLVVYDKACQGIDFQSFLCIVYKWDWALKCWYSCALSLSMLLKFVTARPKKDRLCRFGFNLNWYAYGRQFNSLWPYNDIDRCRHELS